MNYIIILIFLLLLLLVFYQEYREKFDESGTVFLPLGEKRYDLRGVELDTFPYPDCYWDKYSCYTSTATPLYPPYDPTIRP